MSPPALELTLFVNQNFLSPSIFDKVMKWARSVAANGYKFDSPSYFTLKKKMDYTFPSTINGSALNSKVFDDSSNTDCLMKISEHPSLQTKLYLTLQYCQSSDSLMLVSLLPDLEVSDLEKSQSNHKSNGDNLSLRCLKLYHKCSEFLYSAFKDPNQHYDLWMH